MSYITRNIYEKAKNYIKQGHVYSGDNFGFNTRDFYNLEELHVSNEKYIMQVKDHASHELEF